MQIYVFASINWLDNIKCRMVYDKQIGNIKYNMKRRKEMGTKVVAGAVLVCPFGTSTSVLNVTSQTKVLTEGKPQATIKDINLFVNIPPFGMCTSLANPQVAAATAAALGVLTPQPCTMAAAGTWTATRGKLLVGGVPCLCNDAVLNCSLGKGVITITNPGTGKVIV